MPSEFSYPSRYDKINHVKGLPSFSKCDHKCNFCVLGKQARAPFTSSTKYQASKPRELVYIDLCVLITPSILGRGKYFFLIVEVFQG